MSEVPAPNALEVPPEYAELRQRCEAANLPVVERYLDWDGTFMLLVQFPAGRESRELRFRTVPQVQRMLSIPFEEYVFLAGYNAICSYTEDIIEAAIRPFFPAPLDIVSRILRQNRALDSDSGIEDVPISLTSPIPSVTCTVVLGPSSEIFRTLLSSVARYGLLSPGGEWRRPSIRMEGAGVSSHDQAVNVLERISSSLLFQIDLLSDFPLSIERERDTAVRRRSRPSRSRSRVELEFPKVEYDHAPLSLYWYARSATGMPLLQFLAYYQVVEFYFATYSQVEARRQIRQILKDPSFRIQRDADIGRVLSALGGVGRLGFGDERSMLRATILECVPGGELRQFLESDDERKSLFSSKTKGLTDRKLAIADPNADLRNDASDRLYDIRCKIVHTKAGSRQGELELLLPFSKEERMLTNDVDLMRFIAQKVLIAGSTDLRL